METQLARIANKGLAGEPENVVIQELNTLKVFDFSQIKFVNENNSIREVSLIDNDLNQNEIQHILNNMSHQIQITFDESDNITLYF
jgi:hypothetical protein